MWLQPTATRWVVQLGALGGQVGCPSPFELLLPCCLLCFLCCCCCCWLQAFLVQRDTKRQQLEEVLGAFGLRVQREDLLTR